MEGDYEITHYEPVVTPARVQIDVRLPNDVYETRQGTHISGNIDGLTLLSRRIAQAIKEATL